MVFSMESLLSCEIVFGFMLLRWIDEILLKRVLCWIYCNAEAQQLRQNFIILIELLFLWC